MQDAGRLKLGPMLWHMHPVMFLSCFIKKDKIIWMNKVVEKFGVDKS